MEDLGSPWLPRPTISEGFAVGDVVRLTSLASVAHLNGQIGTVLEFLPEKGRYEVFLPRQNESKAVKPDNLVRLPVQEEVILLRDQIERIEADGVKAQPLLRRLNKLQISRDILRETRVGKAVTELAKRLTPQDEIVVSAARQLVRRWREFYKEEQLAAPATVPTSMAVPLRARGADRTVPAKAARQDLCMARVWNSGLGGQCSRRRDPQCGEHHDLCTQHFELFLQDGHLPHGRIDDEAPISKFPRGAIDKVARMETVDEEVKDDTNDAFKEDVKASAAASSSPPAYATTSEAALRRQATIETPASVVLGRQASANNMARMEPISRAEDARRLVTNMRNAASERTRLAALIAVEQTHERHFLAFVAEGALEVLERWLQEGSAKLLQSCLAILEKLPVSAEDIQKSRLPDAVNSIAQRQFPSQDEHIREIAAAIQARWKADGMLVQPSKASAVEEPAPKRRKHSEENANPEVASAPLGQPSLHNLHPRLQVFFNERPDLLEFCERHPSVLSNMTADNIKFLTRRLKSSRDTENVTADPAQRRDARIAGRTVTLSNLHPEATEGNIHALLEGCGIVATSVTLPRESRRQRSCCTAFAVVPTREDARAAVSKLANVQMLGRPLVVEPADGNVHSPARRPSVPPADAAAGAPAPQTLPPTDSASGRTNRRIAWRQDDELWEVALFDRNESVTEFGSRLQMCSPSLRPPGGGAGGAGAGSEEHSARFQAWARSEREAERMIVREALHTTEVA